MTLNRKATIRAIGRRTGLKQRDVQLMLETLIEVWTEELVNGGRVELENFIVLDAKVVHSTKRRTERFSRTDEATTLVFSHCLKVRISKTLRTKLLG